LEIGKGNRSIVVLLGSLGLETRAEGFEEWEEELETGEE
jgi:hypothetical protein